jgi:hypothetical protein
MTPCEDIVLKVGRETITLRPTLRAACRLEGEFGGFQPIVAGIRDLNLTVISAVLRASNRYTPINAFLDNLEGAPLRETLAVVAPAVLQHVIALIGPLENEDNGAPASPITFADYYAKLFRIGTGWLGWTPEETWNATPAEIVEAYNGRIELLKACFGSSDADHPKASLDDQMRGTMAAVIARKRAQKAT